MLMAYQVVTSAVRAHATVKRDADFQACLYWSLAGLFLSLAVLRLNGPEAFLSLAASY